MKYKKRKSTPFDTMQDAAVGLAGVSIGTAVGAGIAAKAPAGTPNLTAGFNTLAGIAPIAVTGGIGMTMLSKMKKKKFRY